MSGRFSLVFSENVRKDLKGWRVYDRRIVLEAIETQLTHTPHVETRQRKLLHNPVPPFEAVPPIWQLCVRLFRVFYDVDEGQRRVYVRAIRRKPAHLKTEEIL